LGKNINQNEQDNAQLSDFHKFSFPGGKLERCRHAVDVF